MAAGSTDEVTAIQASPLPRRNGSEVATSRGMDIGAQALQTGSLKVSPHDRHPRHSGMSVRSKSGHSANARACACTPSFRGIGSQPISENIAIGSRFDVASEAIFQLRSVEAT